MSPDIPLNLNPKLPFYYYTRLSAFLQKPRDKSQFNADSYCEELNFTVKNFLANAEELNKSKFDVTFDAFVTLILNVINKYAPVRRLSIEQNKIKQQTLDF